MFHTMAYHLVLPFDQPPLSQKYLQLIMAGMRAAHKRQKLLPLIKSVELALRCLSLEKKEGITIFSCDSFCAPHLRTQLALFSSLNRISKMSTNFLNIPISHYITSVPDLDILKHAQKTELLLSINENLVSSQAEYTNSVPECKRLKIATYASISLSVAYDNLTQVLPRCEWENIPINGFPFHELGLRDLSLTYKCTPDVCADSSQPFYEHFILSTQFNLWLLIQLIAKSSEIGEIGCAMSFYTATTIFRFFCRQTQRTSRFFGPVSL